MHSLARRLSIAMALSLSLAAPAADAAQALTPEQAAWVAQERERLQREIERLQRQLTALPDGHSAAPTASRAASGGGVASGGGGGVRVVPASSGWDTWRPAANAAAMTDATDATGGADVRLQRLWDMYWKSGTLGFCRVGDRFYHIPGYDPRYDSSYQVSNSQLRLTYELRWSDKFNVFKRTLHLPEEDVAVGQRMLPDWRPGKYGYIYSVQIRELCDDGSVLGGAIRLMPPIDTRRREAERREVAAQVEAINESLKPQAAAVADFRYSYRDAAAAIQQRIGDNVNVILQGFDDLPPVGVSWTGPNRTGVHVALVGMESGTVVAVPMARVSEGLTEEDVIALLRHRGLTELDFADRIAAGLRQRMPMREIQNDLAQWLLQGEPSVRLPQH